MNKQNIISWIALALSIIACIITWARIDIYFTNDTFVGIMASFIGVCATILVGVQIYNSIDTKNTINKLEESFCSKIKEIDTDYNNRVKQLNTIINKLQYELENIKKDKKSNELKMQSYIYRTHGISLIEFQPLTAFEYLYKSLELALQNDDIQDTTKTIQDFEAITKRISKKELTPTNTSHTILMKDMHPSKLENYKLYPLIKQKYTEIYNIRKKMTEGMTIKEA